MARKSAGTVQEICVICSTVPKACNDEEDLLIIKTRRELADAVIAAIKAEHPYEVPEIIALPVIAGHAPYLDWVYGETREP
jgi:uncharacterized protein involved in tolerance to divalent cations